MFGAATPALKVLLGTIRQSRLPGFSLSAEHVLPSFPSRSTAARGHCEPVVASTSR